MTYDPGWGKVTTSQPGPVNIHAAPKNPWTTLTPFPVGADVDFVIVLRSEYPSWEVRSDEPVEITSTPMVQP